MGRDVQRFFDVSASVSNVCIHMLVLVCKHLLGWCTRTAFSYLVCFFYITTAKTMQSLSWVLVGAKAGFVKRAVCSMQLPHRLQCATAVLLSTCSRKARRWQQALHLTLHSFPQRGSAFQTHLSVLHLPPPFSTLFSNPPMPRIASRHLEFPRNLFESRVSGELYYVRV